MNSLLSRFLSCFAGGVVAYFIPIPPPECLNIDNHTYSLGVSAISAISVFIYFTLKSDPDKLGDDQS